MNLDTDLPWLLQNMIMEDNLYQDDRNALLHFYHYFYYINVILSSIPPFVTINAITQRENILDTNPSVKKMLT